jgi:hypothetical protein
VERIRNDGAIPVLQTYPTIQQEHNPTTEYLRGYVKRYQEFPTYNAVIREVSEKYDTLCVDHWAHWVEHASDPDVLDYWQGETIHPGAQGHQQMAILILKELGMYSPNSKCCSLVAGGPRPKPLKPIKEEDIAWFMTYTPATDGVFPADKWSHAYPEGTAVIKDNYLQLNHMDNATNPYATLKDVAPLTNAKMVVTEVALRYPPQQGESNMQGRLYMAIAGAWGEEVSELILVLDDKRITGTISNLGYDAQPGETVTLRFVLDVPSARVACYCNGVLLGTRSSRQETTVGPRLLFGDGASVVGGIVDIRSIRIGTVK